MTVADIPLTTGQPSQGGEGQRFIGYQVYDALINWDLSKRDVLAPLRPGLALSWSVDPATQKIWTFKLRPGVVFHDGTPFDADAVHLQPRQARQQEQPAIRPGAGRPGRHLCRPDRELPEGRRHDRRDRRQARRRRHPLPARQHLHRRARRTGRSKGATGTRSRSSPPAPGPGSWTSSPRAPASNWCATTITGTRTGSRNRTARSCCRCPTPIPASPPCCRARSTGSRRRRPTRSTG